MFLRRLWLCLVIASVGFALAACGPSRENLKAEDKELMGGAKAGDFAQKVAEGDALWEQRGDRAKLKGAIAAWEEAISLESADMDEATRRTAVYDTYVKLSHAYYFLADGHIRFDSDDPDAVEEPMKAAYDKGVTAAEKALYVYSPEYQDAVVNKEQAREEALKLLDTGAVPAMYWYATNLGKWALMIGLAETLGHVDSIFAMITKIEKENPTYWYHAPYRYFGGYYTKLPFPGGDEEQSKKNFETAIAGSPNYLGTRVLYADMFAVKFDDEELFKEQLKIVLETPADVDPAIQPENEVEKKKAQRLMDNMDDLF